MQCLYIDKSKNLIQLVKLRIEIKKEIVMDKIWSEKHKEILELLGNERTCKEAIQKLIAFRTEMFGQIDQIVKSYPADAFAKMPFAEKNGYHSKTLAYSIWHIFRIEDIVAHELIAVDEQIFFKNKFNETIGSSICTTGNELVGEQIVGFSKSLNIQELFQYAQNVMETTNKLLQLLEYKDLKRKFSNEDKERILSSSCVSHDEKAIWLIDYWCNKNVLGLLKMPFSRHWIMHIEAMRRIKNQLCKLARKNIDPVAYCGFSCNHCFLSQWCGSCRTEYNVCSFATCSSDGKCPNASCCQEKGIDGCYECDCLEICEKGFYISTNDGANAAKAQAMFIRKHGKQEFLKVHNRLHKKYDFEKTQEILGRDVEEGLRILEEN